MHQSTKRLFGTLGECLPNVSPYICTEERLEEWTQHNRNENKGIKERTKGLTGPFSSPARCQDGVPSVALWQPSCDHEESWPTAANTLRVVTKWEDEENMGFDDVG